MKKRVSTAVFPVGSEVVLASGNPQPVGTVASCRITYTQGKKTVVYDLYLKRGEYLRNIPASKVR